MEAPPGSGTRDSSAALRVLVVDDHEDSADLVSLFLASKGLTVRVAHDGATALDVAQAFVPNVALLDLNLPDMTGFELLECLRAIAGVSSCRFIAYTGDARESARQQISGAGFAAQLIKPIQLLDLLDVVLGVDGARSGTAK